MAIRVLLPQPILPAGYEFLREHGYEAVDGRGFTEDDIVPIGYRNNPGPPRGGL